MWRILWVMILVGYLLFIYALLYSRKKVTYPEYTKSFSVVIPCYNEDSAYLFNCIKSVMNADGMKKVYLVNDGSTKESTLNMLNRLNSQYFYNNNFKILHQENQGKRKAQANAMNLVDTEVVVFVDSDTIVKKNCFTELLKPMNDKKVGVVTAGCLAKNTYSFFTKVLGSMYFSSSYIFRKASSSVGYMQTVSGACYVFRTEIFKKLEREYVNQKFLGSACHVSDDRWLTQKTQMRFNLIALFEGDAICYTYVPETIKSFMRMLIRWKKGFFREAILIWKEPNKSKHKLLLFDSTFNLMVNYSVLIFKVLFIYVIAYLIVNGLWINLINLLIWFSLWILIFSSAYSMYLFNYKEGKKMFLYKLVYSYMYELIFFITIIPATLQLHKQNSWENRK